MFSRNLKPWNMYQIKLQTSQVSVKTSAKQQHFVSFWKFSLCRAPNPRSSPHLLSVCLWNEPSSVWQHWITAGLQAGLGRWEGFDVSAVFIRVSGSLCSLSIMEEAISPASRPHHKNVSWYKETRWIITRRDSRCSPSLSLCLSLSASLIASVSLIDCLVYFSLFLPRLVFIPLIFLLSLPPLMRLFFFSLSALTVSLSRRLILYKAAVWLYVMLSGWEHTHMKAHFSENEESIRY